jgi:2-dehydro-3-deoxy-D-arabinonate dehydratase
VLAPVDPQHEIWGAGVTYLRSRDGRIEESADGDVYDRVYVAERPELFYKSAGWRAVASGGAIGVRADSAWNAPEPELAIVLDASGSVFGYAPGNDASSRSIEGENPLYLPQAKVFTASLAIGPEIVPAWTVDGPFAVTLSIDRDGAPVFQGETSTSDMARSLGDLAAWLFQALEFPDGVVLLTGTGIVPDADTTLLPGDTVTVVIDGIGTLVNPVELVGRASPESSASSKAETQ